MRLLVLLIALVGMSGLSSAQEDLRILDERDRRELHPAADPTVVSGLKEGLDGFRARTPALHTPDEEVAYVDTDVLYRRRMAMYEQGSTFSSPVRAPREDNGGAPSAPAREVLPGPEKKPLDEDGSASLIVIACLLGVMTGTLVFIRRT